jgi:hypothetical protein
LRPLGPLIISSLLVAILLNSTSFVSILSLRSNIAFASPHGGMGGGGESHDGGGQPEPAPTQPSFGQGGESHDGGGQPEPAPTQPSFGQGGESDDDNDDDDNGGGGEQSTGGGGNIDIDNSKTPLTDLFSSGTNTPSNIDNTLDGPPKSNLDEWIYGPTQPSSLCSFEGPCGLLLAVAGNIVSTATLAYTKGYADATAAAATKAVAAEAAKAATLAVPRAVAAEAGAGAAKAVTLAVARAAAAEGVTTLAGAGGAATAGTATAGTAGGIGIGTIGLGLAGLALGGLLVYGAYQYFTK